MKNKINNKKLLYLLSFLTMMTFGFLPMINNNFLLTNDDAIFEDIEEITLEEEILDLDEEDPSRGGGTGDWKPPEKQGFMSQWAINQNTTIWDETYDLEMSVYINNTANVTIDNCVFRFDNRDQNLMYSFIINTT